MRDLLDPVNVFERELLIATFDCVRSHIAQQVRIIGSGGKLFARQPHCLRIRGLRLPFIAGNPPVGIAQISPVEITRGIEFDGLVKCRGRVLVTALVESPRRQIVIDAFGRLDFECALPDGGRVVAATH